MDLPSLARNIAARLDAELKETATIQHSGSKGRRRESVVLEHILKRFIPESVGIAHGAEIACSDGTTSGECDLVVYDKGIPRLYRSDDFSIFPIEAVVGVIEVRSHLDGRGLVQAANSAHRIKTMETSALKRDPGDSRRVRRYGRIWETKPASAHVVAFESDQLSTLADHLRNAEKGRPRWECLDTVYVLSRGFLLDATGNPQRIIMESVSSESVVMAMAVEFIRIFQPGWQPTFDPGPYLAEDPAVGTVSGFFGQWNEDGTQSSA